MSQMISYFRIVFYLILIITNMFMLRKTTRPLTTTMIIFVCFVLMGNAVHYAVSGNANSPLFQFVFTIVLGIWALLSVYELSKIK